MGNVVEFIKIVFQKWQAMGGLVTFLASVAASARAVSVPAWVFSAIAAPCLFWAFYLAWKAERDKSLASAAEKKATLDGRIINIVAQDDVPEAAAPYVVVIQLEIINSGHRSIVDSFRAFAVSGNRKIPGILHVFDVLPFGPTRKFTAAKDLSNISDAVETGAKLVGHIVVEFPGISLEELIKSFSLVVEFSDYLREQYATPAFSLSSVDMVDTRLEGVPFIPGTL